MKGLVWTGRGICFLSAIMFLVVLVCPVSAQINELEDVANAAGLKGETDIPVLVGRILEVVLSLMGLLLVVLLIIGGFIWTFSGGSEEKVKKAKGLITNAIIGLIIVILAYAAAHFVIGKLTEVTK